MSNNIVNEHALIISRELDIMRKRVSATIRLLDDGATVPFIARYRKEATGSLDEATIRNIQLRHDALTDIYKRRDAIVAQLKAQKALTPELLGRLEETVDPVIIDDIFLPYKQRRTTRASIARDKGLESLAKAIFEQTLDNPADAAEQYVNLDVASPEEALAGATDIIAEWVSENEKARQLVRSRFNRSAIITSRVIPGKEEQAKVYRSCFDLSEPLRSCSAQRYLAMRRGESEGLLKVAIGIDDDEMTDRLRRMFVRHDAPKASAEIVGAAVRDGYKRIMRPSIEGEVAAAHKDRSDRAIISDLADSLRRQLMEPPLRGKRVLAIAPGYEQGCAIVCLDEQGQLLAYDIAYPLPPQGDIYGTTDLLCDMVAHFGIEAIALGDGSGSREAERLLRDIRFPRSARIFTVSEQAAHAYAESPLGQAEFPDLDANLRRAISIGRRLLDPMAELVKVEPRHIPLSPYQADVNQARLKEELDYVVESCVNAVGINLNTASAQLLRYVSGIGDKLSNYIVDHRKEHGPFKSRAELMDVSRMGEKSFRLSAPFLRIPGASNLLDNTAVHPERYPLLQQIADDMGLPLEQLLTNRARLHSIDIDQYATKEAGEATLTDIIAALEKPATDPRLSDGHGRSDHADGDSASALSNLHIGQELTGRVSNVTPFGVFVDIGLPNNGLVHISQLTDRFISSPLEVVEPGQTVRVRVLDIDTRRARVALTMKDVPQS